MAFMILFHTIQTTVRIVLNHDMVLNAWYPFDASVSPVYEIANFTQVMLKFLNVKTLYFHFSLKAVLIYMNQQSVKIR
jgi:hypothetical protein